MTKRTRTATPQLEVPLDLDITAVLETQLQAAEMGARAVLVEHAPATEAALVQFPPWVQKTVRENAAAFGGPLRVEHNVPQPRKGKRPPLPCGLCEAAGRLLFQAGEVRFHLANGAAEAAVLSALSVGRLQLRLGLAEVEDDAATGAANRRDRHHGGVERHGGEAGEKWRAKRDAWIVEADARARVEHPRWLQEKRWAKIADAWNRSLASGDVSPAPARVRGTLTGRNVHRILGEDTGQ